MTAFPYDHLQVGSVVHVRWVLHNSAPVAQPRLGRWHDTKVTYIRRNRSGHICEIAFDQGHTTFDPRYDWNPYPPYPCLAVGNYELQFQS